MEYKMTRSFLLVAWLLVIFGFVNDAVSAKRLGSGKDVGTQRSATTNQNNTATNTTKPAAPVAAPAPAPAAKPSSWLGPMAGLAAGLGLGWLLGHSGLLGDMGGMSGMISALLMGLLAAGAVMLLIRLWRSRNASPPLQYTPAEPSDNYQSRVSESTGGIAGVQIGSHAGLGRSAPVSADNTIPADFDVEGFLKQAKMNFLHLQEANDRGDTDMLHDVTTSEMFAALKPEVLANGAENVKTGGHTEVISLSASLMEVTTEAGLYWASVRFAGQIREPQATKAEAFEEIWHLQKSVNGDSGWVLAGIQQVRLSQQF